MTPFRRIALLAALLLGCNGSPQTEPEGYTDFDADQITVTAQADTVQLHGRAGAATAGITEIWGVSLEALAPLAIAPVAADGSFDLAIPGRPGDHLRLHFVLPYGVDPIDVRVVGDRIAASGDCAQAAPNVFFHDFGARPAGAAVSWRLAVTNNCASPPEALSFTAADVLGDAAGTIAIDFAPVEVAAQHTTAFAVRFTPTAGDHFVYLGLEIAGHERYVVSLKGRGK